MSSKAVVSEGHQPPSILVFVIADMIIFAMLFIGFMVERSSQTLLFDLSSSKLSVWQGMLSTLILVTSGLFVVLAVEAARRGQAALFRRWLLISFIIGSGFGINKIIEYNHKISHGITMLSNDFFMFYYALTGVHFLHFLAGMIAFVIVWFRSFDEPVDGVLFGGIESLGLYWHMVDLLWIFIFPIIYLLGA